MVVGTPPARDQTYPSNLPDELVLPHASLSHTHIHTHSVSLLLSLSPSPSLSLPLSLSLSLSRAITTRQRAAPTTVYEPLIVLTGEVHRTIRGELSKDRFRALDSSDAMHRTIRGGGGGGSNALQRSVTTFADRRGQVRQIVCFDFLYLCRSSPEISDPQCTPGVSKTTICAHCGFPWPLLSAHDSSPEQILVSITMP